MATQSDEYNSLRQELLDHEKSRTSLLSLILTVSAALFAAGAQLKNPLIPLFALLLLYFARIQITQTHYAIQRIASYIRVVLEQDNPDLNWETGSYQIRQKSTQQQKGIWNISPLSPIDRTLLASGLVAIGLALIIAPAMPQQTSVSSTLFPLSTLTSDPLTVVIITIIVACIWGGFWLRYSRRIRELETMNVDQQEARFWQQFKTEVLQVKKQSSNTGAG